MKKNLLIIAAMLLSGLAFSQAEFNTGNIITRISEYGSIEIYTADDIIQLDRASILVGTSPSSVFDYQNDAEQNEPTELVATPLHSDFEIYGAYDNTYSNEPPDVLVKLNAYGWTNKSFIIVRFNITNREMLPMDAIAGMDVIPYLDETWGYDTVSYDFDGQMIRFHRGSGVNMGLKLLSAPLASLYSFEWYDGYYVDSDYYNWMTNGSIQANYYSNTGDGPVTITSQAPVNLDTDESFNVYYALALGDNEADLAANMEEAKTFYDVLVTSNKQLSSSEINLKNTPNPVVSSTQISYSLPVSGFVDLNVYDATGNTVAQLVHENQVQGLHAVNFDASKLSAGIYTYKLLVDGQILTKKLVVTK